MTELVEYRAAIKELMRALKPGESVRIQKPRGGFIRVRRLENGTWNITEGRSK